MTVDLKVNTAVLRLTKIIAVRARRTNDGATIAVTAAIVTVVTTGATVVAVEATAVEVTAVAGIVAEDDTAPTARVAADPKRDAKAPPGGNASGGATNWTGLSAARRYPMPVRAAWSLHRLRKRRRSRSLV